MRASRVQGCVHRFANCPTGLQSNGQAAAHRCTEAVLKCLNRRAELEHRPAHLELLVEDPVAVDQLVGGQHLRLVARHGVEDEEQRLLRELLEVARLQPRRVVPVALRDLRGGRMQLLRFKHVILPCRKRCP